MGTKTGDAQILEVCVESMAGVSVAARAGANRVEVCSTLSIGGVTPSRATVQMACKETLPVHVLIRARGGDFKYSPNEIRTMVDDIERFVGDGVDGLVIGALDSNNDLDAAALNRMIAVCGDVPLTLHRSFDVVRSRTEALEQAIELGFTRILTSGGASDVVAGLEILQGLFEQAGDRITIMPGGGVRPNNLQSILDVLSIKEIHSACSSRVGNDTDYDTVRSMMNILRTSKTL